MKSVNIYPYPLINRKRTTVDISHYNTDLKSRKIHSLLIIIAENILIIISLYFPLRKGSAVDQGRKSSEESNFPVRLVVPSTMIGAIIGKEGKTIRRITDSTGAR